MVGNNKNKIKPHLSTSNISTYIGCDPWNFVINKSVQKIPLESKKSCSKPIVIK